jgi:RasGEF domain
VHDFLGLRQLLPKAIKFAADRRVQHRSQLDHCVGKEDHLAVSIIPISGTVQLVKPSPPRIIYDSSDDLGERMKTYDEWIHTAQVKRLIHSGMTITDPCTKACESMNNFSSAAAIVIALTSSVLTSLALTCESKAKPILHALARELSPTDDVYQNTLQQATTKELIPWLGIVGPLCLSNHLTRDSCADPLLTSLNSTFTSSDPIVEVDGHPLIYFKQCTRLAEQINSLVGYSPPRARPPPDVLSYVEFSLMSCVGDDVLRHVEARSTKLVHEEQFLLYRRERMRFLKISFERVKVKLARRRQQTALHEAESFGTRARDTGRHNKGPLGLFH